MLLIGKNRGVFLFGFLFILILILSGLFFWMQFSAPRDKVEVQTSLEQSGIKKVNENRQIRDQGEIAQEYNQNIKQLLDELQVMEGTSEEIFFKVENGFFNILVPNDLRDLHVQTLLQIRRIGAQEKFESVDDIKKRLSPILNNLLDENGSAGEAMEASY